MANQRTVDYSSLLDYINVSASVSASAVGNIGLEALVRTVRRLITVLSVASG